MNRLVRPVWPFHFVLAALALVAAAKCAARETVLRVGLPHSYENEVQKRAGEGCLDTGPDCVRYRYALGSDYQVLDWLQNGRIDGAVVPGMTLQLVRRTLGDKRFDKEFLVADRLPQNSLPLRRYRVALRAEREGVALPEAQAEAELGRLFRDLLPGGKPEDGAGIDLSSHLSAGAPELFARVRGWLKIHGVLAAEAQTTDAFMSRLLERLRFGAQGRAAPKVRFVMAEQDGGPLAHWFLVRRLALPKVLSSNQSATPALNRERDFLDYLSTSARQFTPESALGRFAAGNYVSESVGWRQRFRFAFTLEELHGILRSHASGEASEDDGIALVLTGGGVKAAYQTKLIDHLYGRGYLRNLFAPGAPGPDALPVKYVVGTSGGALLGIFVASLGETDAGPNLSEKLWKRYVNGQPGPLLSSADVFPAVDLMRWLSLVWCMAIFVLVCAAASIWLRHVQRKPRTEACDEGGRFWRTSVWWFLLLAVAPWFLIYVNGKHGTEHIPAIQGFFYFLYVLIAVYSDNRLIVRRTPRAGKSIWPPLAIGAAGAALIALALLSDRNNAVIYSLFGMSITRPALIACLGVLFLFVALYWGFARCAPHLEPIKADTTPSLLLMVGVCLASYVALAVAAQLGLTSMFELTLEFWVALGAIALIGSAALVIVTYWKNVPFLRRCFDFLLAAHPVHCSHPSHWISTARYSRIILPFMAGWVWWNLLVAPGLYGNENALGYFKAAARNVFGEKAVAADSTALDVTFHAFYAAPVTALEKGVERYVMFQPPQAYEPGASGGDGAPLDGYRSWLSISKDPRWLTIDEPAKQRELVMRVAFASGSPFPVFPAHRITLPGIGEELLVDGGYAHNVPVEAGKRLGARRVLVINSSPRDPGAALSQRAPGFQAVGNLTWMLRWIIPYLYERSQVEDALSAEDLVVGLVAPSSSPKGWPFLTDFRADVIDRMFKESTKDRALRIGSIESWGRPAFARRAAPQP